MGKVARGIPRGATLALAVLFTSVVLVRDAQAQPNSGCCFCFSAPKCDNANASGCAAQMENDPSCVFILGGACQNDMCVGGTQTPTFTSTNTQTATATSTATHTATPPHTATATATDSATATETLAPTATNTAMPADTATATATDTATASQTPSTTATDIASPTDTPVPTLTATDTATPTITATPTTTDTRTATQTVTPSLTPIPTDTPTPTSTPICKSTPDVGCLGGDFPRILRFAAKTDKNKMIWKWRTTAGAIPVADFGDPLTTSDYALCIYAGDPPSLAAEYLAPAASSCDGKPCWKKRTKGFRYKNKSATGKLLRKLVLRATTGPIADIKAVGRGGSLILPSLPFPDQPVTVQLVKSDGPECWQNVYSPPFKKNAADRFKDHSDP